jgi:hypothetical protein
MISTHEIFEISRLFEWKEKIYGNWTKNVSKVAGVPYFRMRERYDQRTRSDYGGSNRENNDTLLIVRGSVPSYSLGRLIGNPPLRFCTHERQHFFKIKGACPC